MDDGEATYKVFAPLRGWYSLALTKLDEALVFAPLRGWYIERMVLMMAMLVFAPLRGLYRKGV